MLWCTRFASTCRVARASPNISPAHSDLAAALIGLLLPKQTDTYFVWQIAVHARFRGRGLARALIHDVLEQHAAYGVRYVEAHVSPDNSASNAMFDGLARSLGAKLERSPDFEPADYPTEHGPEHLLRIGPINFRTGRNAQTTNNPL